MGGGAKYFFSGPKRPPSVGKGILLQEIASSYRKRHFSAVCSRGFKESWMRPSFWKKSLLGSDLLTGMLPTFCPPTIWAISLEFRGKLSILEADDCLGTCCRRGVTPPKAMDFTFPLKAIPLKTVVQCD